MDSLGLWAQKTKKLMPGLLACGALLPNRKVLAHQLTPMKWSDADSPWKILGDTSQVLRMHRLQTTRLEFRMSKLRLAGRIFDDMVVGMVLEAAGSAPLDSLVWELMEKMGELMRQENPV